MGIHKGGAARLVLDALKKSVDAGVRLADFSSHTYIYALGYDRILPKSALAKAIGRLKEKGLVDINRDLIVKLTKKGKNYLSPQYYEKSWDGKWRIVSFDVPEKNKVVRDLFRRKLKSWGFKYLHKSVWISERDIYSLLERYIKELKIEKWVIVMEADKLSSSVPKT